MSSHCMLSHNVDAILPAVKVCTKKYLRICLEWFFTVPCLHADNTPSRCSTPKWHPNAIKTPENEPSPKETKKQLIELFRESFNREQERSSTTTTPGNDHHIELVNMEPNNEKPITSRRSRSVKGESAQSTPCCIPVPKLARSLSLGEKKKRLPSPCHGGGRVNLWANLFDVNLYVKKNYWILFWNFKICFNNVYVWVKLQVFLL